jgi:hypothetical protein
MRGRLLFAFRQRESTVRREYVLSGYSFRKGWSMMWGNILSIITLLGIGALYLFIKNYLPNYMNEKGKNLATKEDIAEITQKTEEVKTEFQKEFAHFSHELQFKHDFYYKRYSELYARLYTIVAQSEYVRYFLTTHAGSPAPSDDVPFIEIGDENTTTELDLFTGAILSHKTEHPKDAVTDFNKKQITDFIIKKGDLASQHLLKLAVAYRYVSRYYSGSKANLEDVNIKQAFDDQELELTKKIVQRIVIDYNTLRKDIRLEFSESELENGRFDDQDFRSPSNFT